MRPAAPCGDRAADCRRELNAPPAAAAAATMRVTVRTLRGERVALDDDGAATVARLKGVVMAREGVAADAQRLFFAGRHLDDDALPLAHYGVRHGSVVFLSLHLRDDASQQETTRGVRLQPEQPVTVRQLIDQQQLMLFDDDDDDDHGRDAARHGGGGGEDAVIKRKPVTRRSLRKILSRLHVDVWTAQHDAKDVGDLTAGDWRAIHAELNAVTRSAFPVEELQRRLAEFRREFEAVSRIKDHRGFSYDARRRVVVATEAEWKRYVLENPEAVAYEGRSPHFGRLRAIFSGAGGGSETRGRGGATRSRESRAKRCLSKLLRSFGLRCKL
ncbi:hypothetical protein C2845_PM01G22670 [Panicum miliaceum]|uniref:Ubiquitin-like domain-containing protein n=1 Tax=Panicum miliaceum TaxID=4540 RepID=A0A3L6TEB7_PANMI|nr:hypothetical protein C2845_PM01G22670 [Panicum miliaceum]